MKRNLIFTFCLLVVCSVHLEPAFSKEQQEAKLKALIVDGQNGHPVWPKSTMMMKDYLEETGLFEVDIYRSKYIWNGGELLKQNPLNDGKHYVELKEAKTDPSFDPAFDQYDVVVSNFGWKAADWPKKTEIKFENYMREGGGLVIVHSGNNSFPRWKAYNQMIGLGGWGGRSEKDGPGLYYDDKGNLLLDQSVGSAGGHGDRHEFVVQTRDRNHPIMKGIPVRWLHTEDELYHKLRGPAENIIILASAYDAKKHKGSGRHEPVLMAIQYGKGRVFHSILGHDVPALRGVGFITTFLRGTEWAASNKVTIPVPGNFPKDSK